MAEKGVAVNKGLLSSTALKYIAIIAMTLDHYGWLFPNPNLAIYVILHFIGRTTAPLMCFFITEGYHYTSNLKRYVGRMVVFALISQAPFMFFYKTAFGVMGTGNMIITLLICLLAVHVVNTKQIDTAFKLPIILAMLLAAQYCDWGGEAVYFTLAFEFARNSSRAKSVLAYSFVCVIQLIPVIKLLTSSFSENWYRIYSFGVFIPAVLILLYNGKRGGSKSQKLKTVSKYFFYIYYPLHIFILSFVRYKMG